MNYRIVLAVERMGNSFFNKVQISQLLKKCFFQEKISKFNEARSATAEATWTNVSRRLRLTAIKMILIGKFRFKISTKIQV